MIHPHQSLIMIMGVQRSGTTALFDILANAHGVSACPESPGDAIYDDFYLRPEPEIREVLHAMPGTVLLKPVRESERRTPLAVAEEYADYNLRIIWLYRDPVNVYHSYCRLGWSDASSSAAVTFASQWMRRNQEAMDHVRQLGRQLMVVCYEDLTSDRSLIHALAAELQLQVSENLRGDTAMGRRSVPEDIQRVIDQFTLTVQSNLRKNRSILLTTEPANSGTGFLNRLRWNNKSANNSPRVTINGVAPSTMLGTPILQELIGAVDVAALYRRWRSDGPLHRDPASGEIAVLAYEACRAIHAASQPFSGQEPPPWRPDGESASRSDGLESYMSPRRPELRARIQRELQVACGGLPAHTPCDLSERLVVLADRIVAAWLALPTDDDGRLVRSLRHTLLQQAEGDGDGAWESLGHALAQRGSISDLLRDDLLMPSDVRAFLEDTCLPLLALPNLVENGLVVLGDRPATLEQLRAEPQLCRVAIDEALRLTPLVLSCKRRLNQPLQIHDQLLPAGSTVDLLFGTANRDPEAFANPDSFRLDRGGPSPFVFEHGSSPLCRLADARRAGCEHLALDVAAAVLAELLANPRRLRTVSANARVMYPRPDGSCVQVHSGVWVLLEEIVPPNSTG